MKVCNKCNKEKGLDDFHKHSSYKDGYNPTCKECRLGHPPYIKPIKEKKCTCCNTLKDLDNFGLNKVKGKYYHLSICKKCRNKKKEEWRKKNPEKTYLKKKNRDLKKKYNINIDDYTKLYNIQEGKCKICGTFHPILAVDHCHVSLKVRGLLCTGCNIGLGMLKDSTNNLINAILYLKETNTDK